MTTKLKARKALLEHFRKAPGLKGLKVDYSFVDENPPECISLMPDISDDENEVRTTRGLPSTYNETYAIGVVLIVASKNTIEENEDRADEILDAMYLSLRSDPRLGGRVDGLVSAVVGRCDVVSGHVLDEGPMVRADLDIEIEGRIAA